MMTILIPFFGDIGTSAWRKNHCGRHTSILGEIRTDSGDRGIVRGFKESF
tara:strand:- start:457 stop:606 length:150 start_codon:yes stop_codon:yes gene_type:complete